MNHELYHYGVKGMKWGVRRYQNPDGSLTSKGQTHRDQRKGRVNNPQSKTSINKNNKTEGMIGKSLSGSLVSDLAPVIVPIAAISALKVAMSKIGDKTLEIVLQKQADESATSDIKSINDMPKKKGTSTAIQDAVKVNPRFKEGIDYQMNCANSSMAYELRRRGYDVEALARPVPTPLTVIESMYNSKFKTVKGRGNQKLQNVESDVSKWGDGRGTLYVNKSNGIGHVLSIEVKNGKVSYMDGQTGEELKGGKGSFLGMNDEKVTFDMTQGVAIMKYIRTDNAKLNDKIVTMVQKSK